MKKFFCFALIWLMLFTVFSPSFPAAGVAAAEGWNDFGGLGPGRGHPRRPAQAG